jgi:hypothetical protein
VLSSPSGDIAAFEAISKKRNRALIILALGDKGGANFKELKSDLNVGVGTLYYHLDGLSLYVTQTGSKQYVLTDLGTKAYDYLKTVPLDTPSNQRPVKLLNGLRETFFFESLIERIGIEPTSIISPMVGILLLVCLLASTFKMEPTILILRLGLVTPGSALAGALFSWFVIFVTVFIAAVFFFRTEIEVLSLAAAASFALIPMLVLMMITGFKRVFVVDGLNLLYSAQFYPFLAVAFAIWAAYILATSLRSAAKFSFERSLVVTLTVLLINIGILWLFPTIKI